MSSPIQRLYIKEAAIMAAFDELSIIKQTGKADKITLQNVLVALYTYPNSLNIKPLKGEDIASTCVNATMQILCLCMVRKAPKHALWTIDKMLCTALQLVQNAVKRTEIKCL